MEITNNKYVENLWICGLAIPLFVNIIAYILCYDMSKHIIRESQPLNDTDTILLLFFTGCFYLFCITYFKNKKLRYSIWWIPIFIVIPLVIYVGTIQELLKLDDLIKNVTIDKWSTICYYLMFYILFIALYRKTIKATNITSMILPFCLNWKYVYTFWATSFIVLFIPIIMEDNIFCILYWWIIGVLTTAIGLYHLYKKHWLDGLLYLCLSLFPTMAIFIGQNDYLRNYILIIYKNVA